MSHNLWVIYSNCVNELLEAYICEECKCYPDYIFRDSFEEEYLVKEMKLNDQKCYPCDFLKHTGNFQFEDNLWIISDGKWHWGFISVCVSNVINNHVWGNGVELDEDDIEPPFTCAPACESYAFHQETIQYTDMPPMPNVKNPVASIIVTLAGIIFKDYDSY